MISHHPARPDCHRYCGSGDIIFIVLEEQAFTCSLVSIPLLFISKAHGMLRLHTQNFTIIQDLIPILVSRFLGETNDEKLAKKTFASPILKHQREWGKVKIKVIAKLFALHANAKKLNEEIETWCRSGVFFINFEHISSIYIVDFKQVNVSWVDYRSY